MFTHEETSEFLRTLNLSFDNIMPSSIDEAKETLEEYYPADMLLAA